MTILNLAVTGPAAVPWGQPGYDPFADLWARLTRPFDPVRVTTAITGLSPRVVEQLVGTAVAASAEADRLLDELPRTIRSLATSMTSNHERCKGELRGPVLWSETMSARASSFGGQDLYVCMTPSRAYDMDENRVLVAALVAVRDAARVVTEHSRPGELEGDHYSAVKRNGSDAARFAEHPSLQRVARVTPTARAVKRTRAGKKSRVYEPALELLRRAANPLEPSDVLAWCDRRTRAQLVVLMGLVNRLEAAGVAVPDVRTAEVHLRAGPLDYHHPRMLGDHDTLSGVVPAGSVLVDVPDDLAEPSRARAEAWLRRRAGGREAVVVMDERDLDGAAALICARLR